jgi:glycosyltransferase involved in cell wall biosynthesis
MKIAWFTPLGRSSSAISQYSACILEQLTRMEQVVVYVSDTDQADACWPVNADLVFLSQLQPDRLPYELSSYDCLIYNLGNHFGYHGSIYEASRKHPGIVIVHDAVLQHFFGWYFLEYKRDEDAYVRHMAYAHGREGEELAKLYRAGREPPVWDGPQAVHYDMAKLAVRRNYGIIVHSECAKRKLEPLATAPVRRINFPEPALSRWFGRPSAARQHQATDVTQVLTFGMINRNKMVDMVIEAIGSSDYLRDHVVYTVLGVFESAEYRKSIEDLIRQYSLGEAVRLLGPQPDETLIESLQDADFCVNLRYPYLGESSWSLLEALYAGKPTVVWRHGYYDEFPDTVVKKVASREELTGALTSLCCSHETRQTMAEEAWCYARKNFDTKQYCRQLLDFIDDARLNRPVLDLIDSISDRLLEQCAQIDSVELVDTLEREICRLAAITD